VNNHTVRNGIVHVVLTCRHSAEESVHPCPEHWGCTALHSLSSGPLVSAHTWNEGYR